MVLWLLPLLGVEGMMHDGAELDAQSLAASLLAQQHAADARQHHVQHDGHAHQKRGLPTMKELLQARQEAGRHTAAVLVEPAHTGQTSSGAPHQTHPAAGVVEAPRRQQPVDEAELESRALASATKIVQQARARDAEMVKERKAIEGAAAQFAAANAKINEWSKEAELAKDTAEARAATKVVAQRAREGAMVTAAAEAKATAEAKLAAEFKVAAAHSAAAFRAREEVVAIAAAEAMVAAQHGQQHAATEMAAAKASPAVLSGLEAAFAANCVDEAAAFMKSNFPITPEALIVRTKEVLTLGIGTKDEGACIADGFEFCAPVIGPLPKDEYLAALNGFKLEDTFDLNAQYHLFRVDPTQPNRVWFHTRTLGTHVSDSPLFGPASGKEIVNPRGCGVREHGAAAMAFACYVVEANPVAGRSACTWTSPRPASSRSSGSTPWTAGRATRAASAARSRSSTAWAGLCPSRRRNRSSGRSASASSSSSATWRDASPRRRSERWPAPVSRRSWHA